MAFFSRAFAAASSSGGSRRKHVFGLFSSAAGLAAGISSLQRTDESHFVACDFVPTQGIDELDKSLPMKKRFESMVLRVQKEICNVSEPQTIFHPVLILILFSRIYILT